MEKESGRKILMDPEKQFINTIRTALGRPGNQPPATLFTTSPSQEEKILLEKINTRTHQERDALIEQLRQTVPSLHMDLHLEASIEETARAIGRLIIEKEPEWGTSKSVVCWDHPLINQLKLSEIAELRQIPIHNTKFDGKDPQRKKEIRSQVEASFIGITSADYCIAATATLAMKTRPGHARSVSLVPSIHVAVVREKQLLADLRELYTLLKWDEAEQKEGLTCNLTLISGPSKTGDIELVMVHGAHGPRELHLFIITEAELSD